MDRKTQTLLYLNTHTGPRQQVKTSMCVCWGGGRGLLHELYLALCVCTIMQFSVYRYILLCVCVCVHNDMQFCVYRYILLLEKLKLSQSKTKPTKWPMHPAKTQISLGIRPVWSESSLCAQWVAKDPSFLHEDSEDSDQIWRMPRLIWVFAGHTGHFVGFVMKRLNYSGLKLSLQYLSIFGCHFVVQHEEIVGGECPWVTGKII